MAKKQTGLALAEARKLLEALAPLHLAGEWDAVGMQVEPLKPPRVHTVFLTIDLTDAVMKEAIRKKANLIVAYHPPLFNPLKRLRPGNEKERVAMRAVKADIAIYSPHSALDAVAGGVADWLAEGLGKGESAPIGDAPDATFGPGRFLTLNKAVSLATLMRRIKKYLDLKTLRCSETADELSKPIETIALCPGAGGGVIGRIPSADLLFTGEMRHHDILAARARGSAVILTEHTNSERGYLPVLKSKLEAVFPKEITIEISTTDRDPIIAH